MENKQNLLNKEKTTKQNRIWVRISAACNNICVFCLDSDAQNGKLIDDDVVKKNIKDGFKPGYDNRIIISGGEASINPKFPEYISYARSIGYDRVQTVTNGNMFFLESFCKKVFDAGLQEVTFSFHGHNSALHDYLVATPGAFKKSLKGLIYVKKYYPEVIVNIDIVVNKVNVDYLPNIVKFFIGLGVYEYDILQIIPFGRGFEKFKDKLFFNISEHKDKIHETWELSKIPGMYMWTNRFHVEAFEGYEDLIQDPRKIKSEVSGETGYQFKDFINSNGEKKPECFGDRCKYCFINQYCHSYIDSVKKGGNLDTKKDIKIINVDKNLEKSDNTYYVLKGEDFPSDVYKKFGETGEAFIKKINSINLGKCSELINIPKCIRTNDNNSVFENYFDIKYGKPNYEEYTKKYINNLYRKKSLRCVDCKYNNSCEGLHLNFIRSYGFKILKPITKNG